MNRGTQAAGQPTPPSLLLLPPQLLHSALLARGATVEQLAGQRTPRGPPEASEDKKGSGSSAPRECSGPGRAQGTASGTLLAEPMGQRLETGTIKSFVHSTN